MRGTNAVDDDERSAASADRPRQGARRLRGRGRPAAAGGDRPGERLRRGDGRADPDEGRGADAGERLVVSPAGRWRAPSHDLGRRRRDRRRRARAEAASRPARRPRHAVQARHGLSHRMRDPRLSLGLGLARICQGRHPGRREAADRPARKATGSIRRSSVPRPRPRAATTRTSRWAACARSWAPT